MLQTYRHKRTQGISKPKISLAITGPHKSLSDDTSFERRLSSNSAEAFTEENISPHLPQSLATEDDDDVPRMPAASNMYQNHPFSEDSHQNVPTNLSASHCETSKKIEDDTQEGTQAGRTPYTLPAAKAHPSRSALLIMPDRGKHCPSTVRECWRLKMNQHSSVSITDYSGEMAMERQ